MAVTFAELKASIRDAERNGVTDDTIIEIGIGDRDERYPIQLFDWQGVDRNVGIDKSEFMLGIDEPTKEWS